MESKIGFVEFYRLCNNWKFLFITYINLFGKIRLKLNIVLFNQGMDAIPFFINFEIDEQKKSLLDLSAGRLVIFCIASKFDF